MFSVKINKTKEKKGIFAKFLDNTPNYICFSGSISTRKKIFWLDFRLDWLELQILKLLDSTRLDSQWLGWLVARTISDSIHA